MHYWKRIQWNIWRLYSPGLTQDFKEYDHLHSYCVRNGINAAQV